MPTCLLFVPVGLYLEISFAKLPTHLKKIVIFNKIKSSCSLAKHTSIHFWFTIYNLYSCGLRVYVFYDFVFLSFIVYTHAGQEYIFY